MCRVNAEAVARRYIALSNAVAYDAMADLFALDADWIPISPIELRQGREAIRRGYLEHVERTNRPIINDRYYSDGNTCVVEFEVDLGDGVVAGVVDVFTVNDDGRSPGLPSIAARTGRAVGALGRSRWAQVSQHRRDCSVRDDADRDIRRAECRREGRVTDADSAGEQQRGRPSEGPEPDRPRATNEKARQEHRRNHPPQGTAQPTSAH